jgi:hypothetical protein
VIPHSIPVIALLGMLLRMVYLRFLISLYSFILEL